MFPANDALLALTRRHFFARGSHAMGWAALASLMGKHSLAADNGSGVPELTATGGIPTHFPPKCKNIIYLHMVGGPPQMDLYDYKPKMQEWYDKDLPDSVRKGQRLTTMTSGQARFPIAPSKYKFKQHGKSGMWVSELLPYTASMVDDMCFVRSMNTEAINHEPAITYIQTGNQVTGRPLPGRVDQLRAGVAEPQPAHLCGDGGAAHQPGTDAGHLGPPVAGRLPLRRACRCIIPLRR